MSADDEHDCSTGAYGGASDSQYLIFVETHDTGKTKVWQVLSKSSGTVLAEIRWFPSWRQYTFRPEPNTIWNTGCMNDINAFIKNEMDARKVKT